MKWTVAINEVEYYLTLKRLPLFRADIRTLQENSPGIVGGQTLVEFSTYLTLFKLAHPATLAFRRLSDDAACAQSRWVCFPGNHSQ